MARLFRIIVPVSGIDDAASFYSRFMGSRGRRISPGRHYFDAGPVVLALYDARADGDEGVEFRALPEPVYLAVADLEATRLAVLAAGGRFQEEDVPGVGRLDRIVKRPWGEVSFYCRDPWGNQLCFVSEETMFTGTDRPTRP